MPAKQVSIDNSLLEELINRIKTDLQEYIEKIIIFGSYARGEADLDSDLDVMALIRVNNQSLKPFRDKLVDIAFDLSLQHNKDISILPEDVTEYEKWHPYIPFFQNVGKDGIVIYERPN